MSLVRHRMTGDIAEELGRDTRTVAVRRRDNGLLDMWCVEHTDHYELPKSIDITIRMTVDPEDMTKVGSFVNTYDTSGMPNVFKLNNGIWEKC